MNQYAPNLLKPLEWDKIQVPNRVAMAPMTRGRAPQNMPNELMATYYKQRASAGLIISEGTFVSEEGIGWVDAPGIWSDKQTEAWGKIVDTMHEENAIFFLQLWHTGRASHSDFHDGDLPVAPSAIRHEGDKIMTTSGEEKEHEVPRALKLEEIPRLVADYKKAAQNAIKAGFMGIEIHAANGYLLDEFLQSKTNHRDDQYGGSIENRFRLLHEILEACTTVYPIDCIGVKISPNGVFNDMGSEDYRETFVYVAKKLSEYNLAYLHVVDGLKFGFHELGEPVTLEEIRKVYPGRIMGNCGYNRDEAEKEIALGNADLMAFGRPFIGNPDLVERFANDWEYSESNQDTWYSSGAEGYTDYPVYQETKEEELAETLR